MKFHSSLLLLAAAIASCALVLSSCGSGISESSNDIKVSEIASWDAGVKAYFKWLGGEGGIDGKLVTLISKDDGEDPAKTAALAREFFTEQNALATVADATQGSSGGGAALLEQQGIPNVGGWGTASTTTCLSSCPRRARTTALRDWPRWRSQGTLRSRRSSASTSRSAGWISGAISRLGNRPGKCAPVVAPTYSSLDQADSRPAVQEALDAGADALVTTWLWVARSG